MSRILTISEYIGKKDNKIIYNEMKKLETGDSLLFGSYFLPGNSDPNDCKIKSPILWQVLDKDRDRLLLLSKYMLYWTFYDGSVMLIPPSSETNWEVSSVRAELNGECFNSWFSMEEQAIIIETVQVMDENPQYHIPAGNATLDSLFLLSLEEANRYLGVSMNPEDESGNECENTAAAAYMMMADPPLKKGICDAEVFPQSFPWWLRTAGIDAASTMCINDHGHADFEGIASDADEVGIRPALWIDLSRLFLVEEDTTDENDLCPFC